jgi:hypothetical protein
MSAVRTQSSTLQSSAGHAVGPMPRALKLSPVEVSGRNRDEREDVVARRIADSASNVTRIADLAFGSESGEFGRVPVRLRELRGAEINKAIVEKYLPAMKLSATVLELLGLYIKERNREASEERIGAKHLKSRDGARVRISALPESIEECWVSSERMFGAAQACIEREFNFPSISHRLPGARSNAAPGSLKIAPSSPLEGDTPPDTAQIEAVLNSSLTRVTFFYEIVFSLKKMADEIVRHIEVDSPRPSQLETPAYREAVALVEGLRERFNATGLIISELCAKSSLKSTGADSERRTGPAKARNATKPRKKVERPERGVTSGFAATVPVMAPVVAKTVYQQARPLPAVPAPKPASQPEQPKPAPVSVVPQVVSIPSETTQISNTAAPKAADLRPVNADGELRQAVQRLMRVTMDRAPGLANGKQPDSITQSLRASALSNAGELSQRLASLVKKPSSSMSDEHRFAWSILGAVLGELMSPGTLEGLSSEQLSEAHTSLVTAKRALL